MKPGEVLSIVERAQDSQGEIQAATDIQTPVQSCRMTTGEAR